MIAAALEAEVDEYVGSFTDELDEDGRRLLAVMAAGSSYGNEMVADAAPPARRARPRG